MLSAKKLQEMYDTIYQRLGDGPIRCTDHAIAEVRNTTLYIDGYIISRQSLRPSTRALIALAYCAIIVYPARYDYEQLKARRLALGWTQIELGERTGIAQGTLSKIEQGVAAGPAAMAGVLRIREALSNAEKSAEKACQKLV